MATEDTAVRRCFTASPTSMFPPCWHEDRREQKWPNSQIASGFQQQPKTARRKGIVSDLPSSRENFTCGKTNRENLGEFYFVFVLFGSSEFYNELRSQLNLS